MRVTLRARLVRVDGQLINLVTPYPYSLILCVLPQKYFHIRILAIQ